MLRLKNKNVTPSNRVYACSAMHPLPAFTNPMTRICGIVKAVNGCMALHAAGVEALQTLWTPLSNLVVQLFQGVSEDVFTVN